MGDSACHLSAVCLSCGRYIEETAGEACPHCGAPVDGRVEAATASVVEPIRVNTILYCDAFSETVDFYRRRLGLETTYANDWFVEFRLAGPATLSIADAARATIPAVEGKGVTISIRVDDLVGLRDRLAERGIQTSALSKRFGSRVFDIFDPEGHRIEFWSEQSDL